ncbi:MAG: helix-turn-helix domain-containing protein [Caldilineaceae bacterium]
MIASNNGALALLRRLRERQGLSQDSLVGPDGDLILTQANYSRVERGLSTPTRDKLDTILDLFKAGYNERREILIAFGYPPPKPLPTQAEMDAIRERCQPTLDALPVPAYITDLITRLVATNTIFEKLIGAGDLLHQLQGQPLFKAQFASHLRLREAMGELDEVLLESVRNIYERLEPYQGEQWYHAFLEELCHEPEFERYWNRVATLGPREPSSLAFATRILHPVQFPHPDAQGVKLRFYSNPEPFQGDQRLQMIYLIPENAQTQRQVERWQNELACATEP